MWEFLEKITKLVAWLLGLYYYSMKSYSEIDKKSPYLKSLPVRFQEVRDSVFFRKSRTADVVEAINRRHKFSKPIGSLSRPCNQVSLDVNIFPARQPEVCVVGKIEYP